MFYKTFISKLVDISDRCWGIFAFVFTRNKLLAEAVTTRVSECEVKSG